MATKSEKFTPWSLFLVLIQVVFITLKLCSVINWSWWWVLAPLWGPTAVGLVVLILCLLIYALCSIFKK